MEKQIEVQAAQIKKIVDLLVLQAAPRPPTPSPAGPLAEHTSGRRRPRSEVHPLVRPRRGRAPRREGPRLLCRGAPLRVDVAQQHARLRQGAQRGTRMRTMGTPQRS